MLGESGRVSPDRVQCNIHKMVAVRFAAELNQVNTTKLEPQGAASASIGSYYLSPESGNLEANKCESNSIPLQLQQGFRATKHCTIKETF